MLAAFLISVLVITGIATLLAVLMVICDATIANYGECKLVINGDKELTVNGGSPLLSTLKERKVFIPSACGGRGSCGLCKVKVTEGAGDFLPTELPWLSDEDKREGVRLSCQIKVKTDMRLEIPAELLSVKEYRTRVVSLTDLTYDIKQVTLELTDSERIDFTAGQFVQFEVPPYKLTDEPVYRAYSLSSPPSDKRRIEMEIRLVPGGICTTYVFEHLKEGDPVTVNGPYGDFHLRDTEREIVFVAGGSGMAPIKSMLLDMQQNGNPRKATYFFGARALRDLFLVDEMRAFEKELADFTFVPALSEPGPEDNWDGETGLVTEVLDRRMGDLAAHEAYLCGSPLMIDACVEVLKQKGLPDDRIYYDKFA
jgi:Na+-transporting NADH:ubiquinone oxidoreductase subunit F